VVWARSKGKREKVPGLRLHPGTVHRARQRRSRRAFSGFKVKKKKGLLNSYSWRFGVAIEKNGVIMPNISGLPVGKEVYPISVPKDKYKFALWLYPETLEKVRELYRQNDCRSKSEFIEKAIRFYIGCLTAEDSASYLPNAFLSNMKSIVAESDNRHSKMLFKLAVEMAVMMNVVAASNEIDEISLARRLRKIYCYP